MRKKLLLSFMLICISVFVLGVLSVSAYEGTKYDDYLYYIVSNGEVKITGCDTSATTIKIPSTIDGKPVTSIGDFAFHACQYLTSITIPNSVKKIGDYAFQYCYELTNIAIPDSVTSIGERAFSSCRNLISVTIPNGVTGISSFSFFDCLKLTTIIIPNSVTSIGDYAFKYCNSLTNITIPYGVTSIGESAFSNCKDLATVVIPNSVTNIGNYAFNYCHSLTNITIPDSVTSIGADALAYCNKLTTINVDANNVKYCSENGILYNADKTKIITFPQGKADTKFEIPDSVTSIGNHAFVECSGLTSITIPSSVTDIGDYAFYHCKNLTNIYYNGTEEQWNKINIDASSNDSLKNATKIYFAYINLIDEDGSKISSKTQNMGEKIDVSAITVPDGYALNLYKDRELTQGYSLDMPISENLTLYVDFIEINKLKISGVQKADIGQKNILQSVTFATDKTAKNLIATVKYPETLLLNKIRSVDFDITQSKYTTNGYTYLNLECAYKNGNMPENKTLNPFDLIFDVSENAKPDDVITIEFDSNTFLADESGNTYDFDSVGSAQITVNPILVQSIVINGESEIDNAVQYTATVLPEKATNKEIEWSVDNAEIASISKDGVLTPIKSGNVKIIATAKDGSNVFGEKTVSVKVYAEISSLKSNIGVWDKSFAPAEREYVIYVPKDTAAVNLTAKHSGKLKAGTEFVYNGREKPIILSDDETIITLTYSCTGYTDSVYTVKFIKFEGTKTTVTESGKSFTIKPVNIAVGNTVILALYNGEEFVETQNVVYTGNDILFTTDKEYKNAKVMVWDNLSNMEPVCDIETVK